MTENMEQSKTDGFKRNYFTSSRNKFLFSLSNSKPSFPFQS